jgi:hypothetical protein
VPGQAGPISKLASRSTISSVIDIITPSPLGKKAAVSTKNRRLGEPGQPKAVLTSVSPSEFAKRRIVLGSDCSDDDSDSDCAFTPRSPPNVSERSKAQTELIESNPKEKIEPKDHTRRNREALKKKRSGSEVLDTPFEEETQIQKELSKLGACLEEVIVQILQRHVSVEGLELLQQVGQVPAEQLPHGNSGSLPFLPPVGTTVSTTASQ